jgi:hypothetical protein
MAAMIFKVPPHWGQCSMSISIGAADQRSSLPRFGGAFVCLATHHIPGRPRVANRVASAAPALPTFTPSNAYVPSARAGAEQWVLRVGMYPVTFVYMPYERRSPNAGIFAGISICIPSSLFE